MQQIWTIARRELRGYFDYPTAYILIVAFLALGLFLVFRTIDAQRIATLRPFCRVAVFQGRRQRR